MAVSGSPVFDPTVATPAPGAASVYDQTLGATRGEAAESLSDYSVQSNRLANVYNQVTAPQLQGSVGTSGNWYSNPGQQAIGQGVADYTNQQTDLASTVQRQLSTLTQQRNWAAIGLIV